ncbi:hypothetical protein [Helicobacter pylori]|uniref:hypothetical protein n=1 Tax=Helicobacter pylori TaxID=210 RepID=UPI000EADCC9E|nr:hypothetical protein [Helicobacter pylori]
MHLTLKNHEKIKGLVFVRKDKIPTITIYVGSHLVFEKQRNARKYDCFLEGIKKPIDAQILSEEILEKLNASPNPMANVDG